MFGHAILIHSDGTLQSVFVPLDIQDGMSMIYGYFSQEKQTFNRIPRLLIDNLDGSETWICFIPSLLNIQNIVATQFLHMCGHDQICYCNVVLFDVCKGRLKTSNGLLNVYGKLRRAVEMSRLQKLLPLAQAKEKRTDETADEYDSDEWARNQTFDTWTCLLVDF